MDKFCVKKWTVPQLKDFLKCRGVPCSGYNKPQLVNMVTKAQNHPELVAEIEPGDGDVEAVQRRTVVVSGQKIIFPDPNSLKDWEENLRNMPYITSAHCLLYLLTKRGWSSNRIQSLEKERGYQLHVDKHIHHVKLKTLEGVTCIKAACTRQTSQNEAPYNVWLLASADGDIHTAGCQCTG